MPQVKAPGQLKPVKRTRKKIVHKKAEPGTRDALLEAVRIAKKHNLDFSYLNE